MSKSPKQLMGATHTHQVENMQEAASTETNGLIHLMVLLLIIRIKPISFLRLLPEGMMGGVYRAFFFHITSYFLGTVVSYFYRSNGHTSLKK